MRSEHRQPTGSVNSRSIQEIAADAVLPMFSGVTKASEPFSYTARCPSHGDRKASLSIRIAEDAKLLLHCHAGCSFREIVTVTGLDLFKGIPIIEVYDYCDADGTLLYQVCRTADKQFPGRMPDGTWGYPKESVLYRLPELIAVLGKQNE